MRGYYYCDIVLVEPVLLYCYPLLQQYSCYLWLPPGYSSGDEH